MTVIEREREREREEKKKERVINKLYKK